MHLKIQITVNNVYISSKKVAYKKVLLNGPES